MTTSSTSAPSSSAAADRQALIERWRPVVAALPEPPVAAMYSTDTGLRDGSASQGQLAVTLKTRPESEWRPLESAMEAALVAQGWRDAHPTDGIRYVKGPYAVVGGCSVATCEWTMYGPTLAGRVDDTPYRGAQVAELLH